MDVVTAKNSPFKYIGLAAICAVFVTLGVLMIFFPRSVVSNDALIGWLSVIFFGIGLLLFLRQIFDSRPRIIIDEQGIFDRTLSVGVIEWQDIEHAYLNSVVGNPFVSLVLTDPEKYLQRAMNSQKKLARLNKYLGAETININLSGIDKSPDEIFQVVLKCILDYKTRKYKLSETE